MHSPIPIRAAEGCGQGPKALSAFAVCLHARHLRRRGQRGYISMLLRIRPTARPSISKGSPGCTTMVG